MMQKIWFKIFIWIAASSVFYLMSCIVIAEFGPGPTEAEVMAFMSGIMYSMGESLMGLSMAMEEDFELKSLIIKSTTFTIPLILISVIGADYVRYSRRKDNGS